MTLREKLERMHRCVGTYGAQDLVSDEEIMSLLDVALVGCYESEQGIAMIHLEKALEALDKALGE